MNENDVLNKLDELFDLDEGTLNAALKLTDISEYDSMAKLSLIVMSDDEFSKKLTAEQINDFETVGDIVKFLIA